MWFLKADQRHEFDIQSFETRLCHDTLFICCSIQVCLLESPGCSRSAACRFPGRRNPPKRPGLYLKATAENGCLHCFGWSRGQSNFSPNSKNGQRTKANLSSDIIQQIHQEPRASCFVRIILNFFLWFRIGKDVIYVAVVAININETSKDQSIQSKWPSGPSNNLPLMILSCMYHLDLQNFSGQGSEGMPWSCQYILAMPSLHSLKTPYIVRGLENTT